MRSSDSSQCLSLFLYTHKMLAVNQSFGRLIVKPVAMHSAQVFSTMFGIRSGPLTFAGLMFFKSLQAPSTVIYSDVTDDSTVSLNEGSVLFG